MRRPTDELNAKSAGAIINHVNMLGDIGINLELPYLVSEDIDRKIYAAADDLFTFPKDVRESEKLPQAGDWVEMAVQELLRHVNLS